MRTRNFDTDGIADDEEVVVVDNNEESAPESTRAFAAPDRFSPKSQDFKSAFADARSAGSKTFEFKGKKYTTDLAKSTPSATEKAFLTEGRGKNVVAKPKYQSLQDRAEEYAMKNKAAGRGMYGTKKSVEETRTPKRARNLTDMVGLSSQYAKGGSVSSRADGIAQRGKTRGKVC
jgi:hypothetical protein